jgi:leucyl aminopeptidase
MNLKLFVFLLSVSSLGKANPIGFDLDNQAPLGYDLDLNALRLVQLEGKDPVWMTEIEKVGFSISSSSISNHWPATQIQVKAQGFKFFDM